MDQKRIHDASSESKASARDAGKSPALPPPRCQRVRCQTLAIYDSPSCFVNHIEYMQRWQRRRWQTCLPGVCILNDFMNMPRWQKVPPKGGIKPCHCYGKVYSLVPLGTAEESNTES